MPYAAPRFKPAHERKRRKETNPFYLSKSWRDLRKRVLVRDAYTCQQCYQVVTGRNAHVDHIVELIDGGSELDERNLRCMCSRCHGKKTQMMQELRRKP